jgi:PAS domain S-box-containing protein
MIADRQELAQTLFEEAGDALFLFDPDDGQIIEINPMAQRLCGTSRPELLEESVGTLFRSESPGGIARLRRAYQTTGVFHSQDGFYLRQRKEGRWLPVNLAVARLHVRLKTLGLITARGVSERKRSENLLRLVWETAADGMRLTDAEGSVVMANLAYCRLVGRAKEEVVGRPMADAYAPSHRADALRDYRDRFASRIPREHQEVQVDLWDGRRRWFEIAEAFLDLPGERPLLLTVFRDTTDRKQAERALRESEGRYRSLVESSADGIFVNKGGRIVFANPALLRMLGADSPDQVLGRSPFEIIHPDYHPLVRERIRAILETRRPVPFIEEKYVRFDGTTIDVEIAAAPFEDRGEVAILVTSRDVTERKRAEDALRREREFVRLVLDTDPNLIFVKDADGRFVLANKALADLYDTTPEGLVGRMPGRDLPAPAELPEYRRVDQEVLRTGRPVAVDETNTRPGGRTRWFHTIKAPLALPGGTTHVLGISADVTQRRQVEEALRERKELFRTVLNHVPCGVFRKDRDSVYLGCNDQIARDLGLASSEELVGRTERDVALDPEEAARSRECDLRVVETGEPLLNVEEVQTRPGGTKAVILTSRVPLRDASGAVVGVLGVYQDITDRKRIEEQLRQAQKMEAVGQLAGGVAHDFNNLLTIINGYSDLLLQTLPADDPSRVLVEEIYKAGQRSAGLTRQLLAFSRRQVVAPRVLDLNALVCNAGKMLRRVIGEDVRLTTALDSGLCTVRADPGQIEQVLLNLAVNARDAMPTGGRLTIETRNVDLDDDYARTHPGARGGPHVLLAVSDTGCGMPPEVKARVFEPFFTTKGPGKGTGLGLATVYGIVQQAGGHVGVSSEVGVGTTFEVYLPRENTPAAAKPRSGLLAPPRGTETVLLVEDEDGVRALTRCVLTGCGYTVLEAAEGDEAVRAAAGHTGPIHLLVSDVVMPGPGGRAVADRVAELRPGVRVLFVSGYTDDVVVRHGVLQEGVSFLQKPFSPIVLAHRVREILDSPS